MSAAVRKLRAMRRDMSESMLRLDRARVAARLMRDAVDGTLMSFTVDGLSPEDTHGWVEDICFYALIESLEDARRELAKEHAEGKSA